MHQINECRQSFLEFEESLGFRLRTDSLCIQAHIQRIGLSQCRFGDCKGFVILAQMSQ